VIEVLIVEPVRLYVAQGGFNPLIEETDKELIEATLKVDKLATIDERVWILPRFVSDTSSAYLAYDQRDPDSVNGSVFPPTTVERL
jgi:hypothetical protein